MSPDSGRPVSSLVILGSTGSIGCAALEVLRTHAPDCSVQALVARSNDRLLFEQALEFRPKYIALADTVAHKRMRERLQGSPLAQVELLSSESEICELCSLEQVDTVIAAMVGMCGLRPVMSALRHGKRVALANKETLVVAGEIMSACAKQNAASVLPVDSEHSALFQLLRGVKQAEIKSLVLTASGGPFLKLPKSAWASITKEQALKHPTWNMGAKISIDSATLINKALEIIEAYWLFLPDVERLGVLVHPQSLVHAILKLRDGTQLLQASLPDMKAPIAYALSHPNGRFNAVIPQLELDKVAPLEFLELDQTKFPAIHMAKQCLSQGGAACAVLNIANELLVEAFLQDRISFDTIVPRVQSALSTYAGTKYQNLDDLFELENEMKSRGFEAWS